MPIDWFTVGAQALNFILLVWLMKRFLYGPILQAIDAREKRIAGQLRDAEARQAEAVQQREELQGQLADLAGRRTALLREATDDANAERQRLLEAAREAAEALAKTRQAALAREQQTLGNTIVRRTQEEVLAIARQALQDLAGTRLEAQISDVFARRLRDLPNETRQGLATALEGATEPAIVRSAFELPPAQRATLQHALNETFAADIPLRFETAPALVSGVELATGGHKVAWSIAEYLASLERGLAELMREGASGEPHGDPAAPPPEPPSGGR